MKKNLILLTGIVFLITILAAGGCGNNKKNDSPKEEIPNNSPKVKDDSTKVDIYLKAVLIDGSMHLEMYDSRKHPCPAIDGLITVVYPGYTVTWKKAAESNINQVEDIRLKTDDGKLFGNEVQEIKAKSLWTLEIPATAKPDTIKYEIDFNVTGDKDTTYTIDPYIKIPRKVAE
jgi:hypothetical protein